MEYCHSIFRHPGEGRDVASYTANVETAEETLVQAFAGMTEFFAGLFRPTENRSNFPLKPK
jgi:hypothetical protein